MAAAEGHHTEHEALLNVEPMTQALAMRGHHTHWAAAVQDTGACLLL